MAFDVSLAGWMLSAGTFLLGTVTPLLVSRLTFDGISIGQLDVRSTQAMDTTGTASFGTVLKIANVNKQSVLLDRVRVPNLKVGDTEFHQDGVRLKVYEPGEEVRVLPSYAPDDPRDTLPILVKPDEERLLAIEVFYTFDPGTEEAGIALGYYIEENGLNLRLRINGKYRAFTLRIGPQR